MFTTRGRALSCNSQGENMPGRLFFMASHICHHILPAFCTECWHPVSVNNITTARWSTLDGFSITLVNVSQSAACGENGVGGEGGGEYACAHMFIGLWLLRYQWHLHAPNNISKFHLTTPHINHTLDDRSDKVVLTHLTQIMIIIHWNVHGT